MHICIILLFCLPYLYCFCSCPFYVHVVKLKDGNRFFPSLVFVCVAQFPAQVRVRQTQPDQHKADRGQSGYAAAKGEQADKSGANHHSHALHNVYAVIHRMHNGKVDRSEQHLPCCGRHQCGACGASQWTQRVDSSHFLDGFWLFYGWFAGIRDMVIADAQLLHGLSNLLHDAVIRRGGHGGSRWGVEERSTGLNASVICVAQKARVGCAFDRLLRWRLLLGTCRDLFGQTTTWEVRGDALRKADTTFVGEKPGVCNWADRKRSQFCGRHRVIHAEMTVRLQDALPMLARDVHIITSTRHKEDRNL